ncbi:MAG: hypothetical protein ACK42C_00405 [Aquificaceae bacterium]
MLIPAIIKKLTEKGELPTYPVLDKKPLNISQSGNTYTVDWVIYYANNTNSTQNGITITEGPLNTIVPGSLQQPSGWSGSLNSTNTVATWTGNAPPVNGYMSANVNTGMASSFNVTGGGDGYRAFPYRHMASGGKLRIYFINHHEPMFNNTSTGQIFKCVDTLTGNYCSGFPKNLPKGDGSGKFSSSGMYDEEYYIDSSGRLYYAVTANDKEFGLGCYNLETDTECGFYKLGVNPTKTWSYVKGPWKVGNELYMVGGDRKLYCLDATNPANFCMGLSGYYTGFSFPAGAFLDPNTAGTTMSPNMSFGPGVFGEVVGSRIYFITDSHANAIPKTLRSFCFDTVTKSPCAGWTVSSQTHGTPMTYPRVWSSFIYYNNAMNPVHICARLNGLSQYCFSLSSGLPSSPPVVFSGLSLNTGFGSEITMGSRSYFPDFMYQAMSSNPGRVLCWDWSTGAPCAPTWEYKSWTHPTKGNPRDYTVNVDDKGCIWVVGDNAPAMWYFDPAKPPDRNGHAGKCESREGKFEQTFQPWQYCSGPKPFLWLRVDVANASLSDFSKLEIRIKDSSNNTIFVYDCLTNSSLSANLSGISAQTSGQPLNVEVFYALSSGVNLQSFEIRAYYHASPLEFCLKSRHDCLQDAIKNPVNVSGQQVSLQPKVEVELTKPEECPVLGEGAGSNGPGGGTGGSGPSSGAGGTVGQTGGGSGSSSTGAGPGILLTPSPLPSTGSSGASGAIVHPPTAGGAQVVEKDGQLQILPEAKQRCYWRPKQKHLEATQKPPTKPAVSKKASVQAQKPKKDAGKPVAQKPKKKPAKAKVATPQQDMEYVCEPEK